MADSYKPLNYPWIIPSHIYNYVKIWKYFQNFLTFIVTVIATNLKYIISFPRCTSPCTSTVYKLITSIMRIASLYLYTPMAQYFIIINFLMTLEHTTSYDSLKTNQEMNAKGSIRFLSQQHLEFFRFNLL